MMKTLILLLTTVVLASCQEQVDLSIKNGFAGRADFGPSLHGHSNVHATLEGSTLSIDFNDSYTNSDYDRLHAKITYTCSIDNSIDGVVLPLQNCSTFLGDATFDESTGKFMWLIDVAAKENG